MSVPTIPGVTNRLTLRWRPNGRGTLSTARVSASSGSRTPGYKPAVYVQSARSIRSPKTSSRSSGRIDGAPLAGRLEEAAQLLGLSRKGLYLKRQRLGIADGAPAEPTVTASS